GCKASDPSPLEAQVPQNRSLLRIMIMQVNISSWRERRASAKYSGTVPVYARIGQSYQVLRISLAGPLGRSLFVNRGRWGRPEWSGRTAPQAKRSDRPTASRH